MSPFLRGYWGIAGFLIIGALFGLRIDVLIGMPLFRLPITDPGYYPITQTDIIGSWFKLGMISIGAFAFSEWMQKVEGDIKRRSLEEICEERGIGIDPSLDDDDEATEHTPQSPESDER